MRRKKYFQNMHPWVLFCYFLGALFFSMGTMNPWVLGCSAICGAFYAFFLCREGLLKEVLILSLPVAIISMGIFPLFQHNGVTPLFYVNGMAVTREQILFGAVVTMMLTAVFLWFRIWTELIDSERFLYLFGRFTPSLGLYLSMVFRLLPLLRERYRQICEAQVGLGRTEETLSLFGKIQLVMKKISVLISWSLESSLETSVSMESRGYGCRRRTSFSLFHFRWEDACWIIVFFILYGITFWVFAVGGFQTFYFPKIIVSAMGPKQIAGVCTLCAAELLPLFADVLCQHSG